MKTVTNIIYFAIALFAFACFALSPRAQAVSPAPDGGYPGGNTAEGQSALFSLTTGGYNTAVGYFSLRSDATGQFNTAVGAGALFANTGDNNTATGAAALLSNTTGINNTANGALALEANTGGNGNTAIGSGALFSSATGFVNTAVGNAALSGNTTGNHNTALGASAGENLTTGDNNIDIGFNVPGVAGEANTIRIGNTDITTTIIRGISGQTIPSGATVIVASNGQLGTMTSSERFKDEIKPMGKASEAILTLRPVSFRYKKNIDPQGVPQFGLVAEEVDRVNPDLIIRDAEGKPQTVRYEQVNAMLLNEFLKEHRTVQELKSEIAALTATVKEQAAQIQNVSAQLQLNKPMMQTVSNNH